MSAHQEIVAKYDAMVRKAQAKKQQGLGISDVPLTLQDGLDLVKLMVKLGEEMDEMAGPKTGGMEIS